MNYIKVDGHQFEVIDMKCKVGGHMYDIDFGVTGQQGKWMEFWNREFVYTNFTDLYNVDLHTLFNNSKVRGNYTLINHAIIGSENVAEPALIIDGFPEGSTITIINTGYIVGKGGDGGFSDTTDSRYKLAENGGDAIHTTFSITINNTGVIGGGGGGGGGSRGYYQAVGYVSGSGGAGSIGGAGGNNYRNTTLQTTVSPNGGLLTSTVAPTINVDYVNGNLTLTGGRGGSLGQAGTKGTAYRLSSATHMDAGVSGIAIVDNGNIINVDSEYGITITGQMIDGRQNKV